MTNPPNSVVLSVGALSKIIIYPVVYAKDTNGDILLDTDGNKIIEKNYRDVSPDDDYVIITEIISGE